MKIKALIRRGAYCPGLTSLRVKTGPVTLLLLLCLALLSLAQEPNSDALRRGQLKHMGGALRAYQIIHDGKSPAKLSDLYREGLAESLSDFVRPGDPRASRLILRLTRRAITRSNQCRRRKISWFARKRPAQMASCWAYSLTGPSRCSLPPALQRRARNRMAATL